MLLQEKSHHKGTGKRDRTVGCGVYGAGESGRMGHRLKAGVVNKRVLYGVGSDVGYQVGFIKDSLNPPWDDESRLTMGILNPESWITGMPAEVWKIEKGGTFACYLGA